ncbi:MAG: ATP-dependent Clp protease ATP-binding subunit [Lactobacillales bacterium]|jgi:ATP-dependent Clp protease ATP-binding subunit ClpC|nr:ATP-dependent Clp protease ATP-binding subunit [Lactobacillales bacterium]
MDNLFTKRAKEVLRIAQKEAKYFKQRSVGSEHLLLALVIEPKGIAGRSLRKFRIDEDEIREEIKILTGYGSVRNYPEGSYLPYSPRTRQVLNFAANEAKRLNTEHIGTEHLLLGLIRDRDILASRILVNLGINLSKLRTLLMSRFGTGEPLSRPPLLSILETISYESEDSASYSSRTPTLDGLARDLTMLARKGELDPVIGRDDEIKRVLQILSRRTKNNPVLVGEPGVGKTSIAEGIAERIVVGDVPKEMLNQRVMVLDMGSLVAGTKYRGEFEERFKKVIDEIYEDRAIILFIDELHTLIGAGGSEGSIDASNILKPALARGELQTIGATTLDEYQKYIEKDSALERRFARVFIEEPTEEGAIEILDGLRSRYEDHHGVKITDEALQAAVSLSTRYINNRQLPDKAIDIMDEASARVRLDNLVAPEGLFELRNQLVELEKNKRMAVYEGDFALVAKFRLKEKKVRLKLQRLESLEKKQVNRDLFVNESDIAEVVSQWTGVPLKQLAKKESDRLLKLEDILHARVVGQNKAVIAISKAIRRARSGLKDPFRPIGSFMFMGPTGVGKTELARTLAEAIFGSEEAMIRVDMSEFMEKQSISRLIGSPPGYVGYEEGGQLTEKIRQKPYSVILLDEVEKAHMDVFNLLLQVFDDGYLTDAKGRKVDFRNTILIMTSNIGATALREEKSVGFNKKDVLQDYEKMKETVLDELRKTFQPEFLNRIDETVVFRSLEREEIREIVKIMSKKIIKRLKKQGIRLKITASAIDLIGKVGFDPEYGARPIRRALQHEVEDRLSEALLSGEFELGDHVTIGTKKGQITLTVKRVNEDDAKEDSSDMAAV